MGILGQDILAALKKRSLEQAAADALASSGAPPRAAPRESIVSAPEVQDAPLSTNRLRSYDFPDEVRRDALAGTPEERDAMLRSEVGPLYDAMRSPESEKLKRMLSEGPGKHKPSGFWSRAKDVLLGASLNARRGGQDNAAAFGGLIGGAIGSAIDPNMAHELKYEDVELPRQLQKAQTEQAVLGQDIARAMKIGDLTGVDPYTGKPTWKAELAQSRTEAQALRDQIARDRADAYVKNVANMIDARTGRVDVQRFNAQMRAWKLGGVALPELKTQARAMGVELPSNYDPQKHEVYYRADGTPGVIDVITGRDIQTGQAPADSLKGRSQTEQERHNVAEEGIQRAREARLSTSGGPDHVTKTDVGVAVTEEWMKAGKTPTGKEIKDGYIVDGFLKTPLEQDPEYKREVNKRYSNARKQATVSGSRQTTISRSDYDARVKQLGGDEAARQKVDAALRKFGITVK